MPVFLIATIQCPGSYGTYFNGPISIPCHIVLSTQIGLLYRYTLVLANPPTGVFCYCCLVSRYSCTLYRYVRLSIADISWLQVPYILESIPHPNLIRISFCRFLNPLNAELNPICHLLALLGGATIIVVSRLRVKRKKS